MAKRSSKTAALSAAPAESNLVTSFRWGWYGLSLFVPFAGVLIGLFLYDQDSRDVRKVGRNCLFIGFLVWVVFPIVVMLIVGMFLGLALVSYVADMIPAGGD